MARRNKKKPLLEQVEITDIGSEGKALARVENKVVFVPYTAPGDIVDIQVTRKRKNFLEGFVTKYHKYSEDRIDAFCEHFGTCGGCKWQHLPYEIQLKAKQQQVADNLERIAKIPLPEISPIMGSAKTRYYRNKLEFTFSNRRWLTKEEIEEDKTHEDLYALGFHVPKLFDKVLDINTCYLQNDFSNKIRNEVRDFALKNNYTFFDIRNHHGLLRNLIIRNTASGQWMVIVVFYEDDQDKREKLLEHLKNTFPEITSLNYIINSKANDSIADQQVVNYAGTDHLLEEMEGLQFKIGPKSFYQTNSDQAYELYKVARNFAGLTGDETVYDLYTGTGTIANFLASKAKNVIGIEYIEEAVEDARFNSELNKIGNTSFYAGDMRDLLNREFFETHGKPEIIITDPPRAGMHQDVVNAILESDSEKIVYISCNPATQARDLALLNAKYEVKKIQPVDMFPHTHHIENVALLEKNI
ncbi:23S rRNA (uracil-C(5))-methyltransferase RlmCD [Salinivirga cyanobacteriivorans]|uniref:23S rRNA (Uracil-C(5))-methyltransferase RlmCD n=1 Tax=Salinivirga cyanobacteriivorans TaxID=1307839 RepID=A0A0S2I3N4_9BACT|nr:23S rRNA (uracil(1939)-C(5))-methyltransferase RlmD [Salinivirga cyanobacteriivorans]ALO16929.1 23S rRNA (uracil-C(5))-methyltransferase RlmCD [Salinivirga cyanobacteriivorans]